MAAGVSPAERWSGPILSIAAKQGASRLRLAYQPERGDAFTDQVSRIGEFGGKILQGFGSSC